MDPDGCRHWNLGHWGMEQQVLKQSGLQFLPLHQQQGVFQPLHLVVPSVSTTWIKSCCRLVRCSVYGPTCLSVTLLLGVRPDLTWCTPAKPLTDPLHHTAHCRLTVSYCFRSCPASSWPPQGGGGREVVRPDLISQLSPVNSHLVPAPPPPPPPRSPRSRGTTSHAPALKHSRALVSFSLGTLLKRHPI